MAFILISFWYDILICILIILFGCLLWINNRYKYWSKKGVISPPTKIPFGNIKDMVLRKKHMAELFQDIYNEYKHLPYVGTYSIFKPGLVINDLNLVKDILTKDFVHFSGHGFPVDEEAEPISAHLFNVDGAKWKYLRTKLTPTFTSSKMKMMYNIVNDCANEMKSYLNDKIENNEILDVKDVLGMFGNDIIANCAFGIECNTFKNPNEKFRKMGKRLFNPTVIEQIVGTIDFFFPHIITKLKTTVLTNDIEKFFYGIVEETVNYREKNGIVRNDFMQLLIQLRNQGKISDDSNDTSDDALNDGKQFTIMQMAAQAFVFFIAGFETSSSVGSFALYEMALNPDIQTKAIEEIDEILKKNNGEITYDSLFELTYLTKVIEETMRKYPALPVHFRICTKSYVIPNTNFTIEKGTPVTIPIFGIHKDPDIYSNPDKFDPERFSPENKETRHHFSYLPFGEGPRICIGSRFGMMQVKLGLVTILSKYTVQVCKNTPIPIIFDPRSIILTNYGELWLKIERRT